MRVLATTVVVGLAVLAAPASASAHRLAVNLARPFSRRGRRPPAYERRAQRASGLSAQRGASQRIGAATIAVAPSASAATPIESSA
jgi:hypothetical protein